ncbi:MAG: OB-fold nucleic acid binding domain-containing protein, partial [Leifsonia sp.]
SYPTEFSRTQLDRWGVKTARDLKGVEHGTRVLVAGVVTHRQRPATASGIIFINLEDETGMLNVVCSPGLWVRFRRVARTANALVVRGRLEVADGVTNLVAEHLAPLRLPVATASRDFR